MDYIVSLFKGKKKQPEPRARSPTPDSLLNTFPRGNRERAGPTTTNTLGMRPSGAPSDSFPNEWVAAHRLAAKKLREEKKHDAEEEAMKATLAAEANEKAARKDEARTRFPSSFAERRVRKEEKEALAAAKEEKQNQDLARLLEEVDVQNQATKKQNQAAEDQRRKERELDEAMEDCILCHPPPPPPKSDAELDAEWECVKYNETNMEEWEEANGKDNKDEDDM